jgi:plasmid stability protein
VVVVAAMSIRNIDERVMDLLRIRAARHGRSMEAEVRAILVDAVREPRAGRRPQPRPCNYGSL